MASGTSTETGDRSVHSPSVPRMDLDTGIPPPPEAGPPESSDGEGRGPESDLARADVDNMTRGGRRWTLL